MDVHTSSMKRDSDQSFQQWWKAWSEPRRPTFASSGDTYGYLSTAPAWCSHAVDQMRCSSDSQRRKWFAYITHDLIKMKEDSHVLDLELKKQMAPHVRRVYAGRDQTTHQVGGYKAVGLIMLLIRRLIGFAPSREVGDLVVAKGREVFVEGIPLSGRCRAGGFWKWTLSEGEEPRLNDTELVRQLPTRFFSTFGERALLWERAKTMVQRGLWRPIPRALFERLGGSICFPVWRGSKCRP